MAVANLSVLASGFGADGVVLCTLATRIDSFKHLFECVAKWARSDSSRIRCHRGRIRVMSPPESVPADAVDLVRWRADWAPSLASAVAASLLELAPYMPWATPAYALSEAVTYIDSSIADWDAHVNWNYAIVSHSGDIVGSTGLMTRMGPRVLEIGYWLHTGHAGRGYATAAARALADVGLAQPDIDRVLIRHDAANVASGRVAQKAGFTRLADVASTIDVPEGSGVEVRWERRA